MKTRKNTTLTGYVLTFGGMVVVDKDLAIKAWGSNKEWAKKNKPNGSKYVLRKFLLTVK